MRRVLPLAVLLASLTAPVLTATPALATSNATVVAFAGGGVGDSANALEGAVAATGADVAPDGTIFIADGAHNRIRTSASGALSTFAGTGDLTDGKGGFGGDGGPASAAKLSNPSRVRVNGAGDVYVIDSGNHRLRFVDHATGLISTIAGNGGTGGAVASANAASQPMTPVDVAFEPTGTGDVALVDSADATVWALHTDGSISALMGPESLTAPSAAAYLSNGDLLVADSALGKVLRLSGGVVSDAATGLAGVNGLAVSSSDVIYAGTPAGVQTFSLGGTPTVVTGTTCGNVAALDHTGALLQACKALYQQQIPSFAKIAGNLASEHGVDAPTDGVTAANAPLSPSGGLAVIGDSTYVTDRLTVDRVETSTGIVHTVAGTGGTPAAVADGTPATSAALTSPTGVAAAVNGTFVVDNGKVLLITGDGAIHPYAGSAPTATIVEGEAASALPAIGPITSNAAGDLYFGSGDLVGVIDHASQTVHIIAASLRNLRSTVAASTVYETARVLALAPNGSLLVLSDEGDTNDSTVANSRVRSLNVSTGAFTLVSYGARLSALAVGGDATLYVAETRTGGSVIERLGTDGSTALLAGGGHLTTATQAGTDLYLPDVSGLGIAPDGGVLIASKGLRRVLEIQPGFVATSPSPVTNIAASPAMNGDGTDSTTFTWDLPGDLASGSHLEIARAVGPAETPLTRDDPFLENPPAPGYVQGGETPGLIYTISVYVVTSAGEVSAPTSISLVAPGDTTPPSAPTIGQGYSADSSFTVDWTPSTSADLKQTEVRIAAGTTAPAPTDAPAYTGTDSTATLTGLTVGQLYTVTLTSVDNSGNATASGPATFLAGSAPTPLFGAAPAEGSFNGPSVSITPTHQYSFTGTGTCTLDGVARACTADAANTLSGLSTATHTFSFSLTTAHGNGPTISRSFKVDASAPAVGVSALAPFTVAGAFAVKWAGADTGSGLSFFRVRYNRAGFSGPYSAYAMPAAFQHLTTRTVTIALPAGYTYCAQVQAVDKVGNTSAWSTPRCTTRPLDDRSLAATASWKRLTSSLYFGKTYTATKTAKAALIRSGATFRQLALLVSTCRTCGSVGVYSGSTLIRNLSLVSSTTRRQVLIVLPVLTTRAATIYLRVTSATGRNVEIDGLGISRS